VIRVVGSGVEEKTERGHGHKTQERNVPGNCCLLQKLEKG